METKNVTIATNIRIACGHLCVFLAFCGIGFEYELLTRSGKTEIPVTMEAKNVAMVTKMCIRWSFEEITLLRCTDTTMHDMGQ